jgi:serine/threonine protein kinase
MICCYFRPFDIPAGQDPDSIKTPFISDSKYNLDFFDTIEPIHSIHMGYFALSTKVKSTGVSCYQKDVTKYVLKRLFKSSVVLNNEVKHVLDEAKILEELSSPFILCMLGKFQTCDELVFVFEIVPSGDLWSLIHERDELRDAEGFLSIEITRFYIANIILALEHMHVKNIAYRNLKPENILMGADGYVKISGMAFAKVILLLIVIIIVMLCKCTRLHYHTLT